MKRTARILLALLLAFACAFAATGCAPANDSADWTGRLTDLSQTYLSKGYVFNLYRYGSEVAGDDSYGKSYVNMAFQILPEIVSTNLYDASAGYNVKKVSVTNVSVSATPKKGTVGDLAVFKPGTVDPSGPRVDIVGTVKRADFDVSPPNSSGRQLILYLEIDQIALYDIAKSPAAENGATPTTRQIYGELGIDRSAVALTLSFRIELLTVSGKILFHEYAIELPPADVDVAGDEFHYEYLESDVADMEPFLEK